MSRYFRVGMALFFLMMAVVNPVLAQSSGSIAGTVTDESGAVLPGVNVTLSSAQGTLGANQTTVTDDRGAYQFLRLVPGTYVVKGELQGFRPAEQQNITVNADATARADLKLLIGSLEEGVTVSGEAPLLDTTSALKQTVLSREVIEALPNRVDVWSMTRVIPSIVMDKVDVGGSEAFVQSRATVRGSSTESGYFIDGIEVSSLDGNGSGATFYLNPYAFQEASYQIGGPGTAMQSKGGLIYNVISRTGTNQFHGSAMINGSSRGMSSDNFSEELEAELLAAVPPAALAANPDLKPGNEILKTYDTGAWISGPIVRDRLWFSGSVHYQYLDQYPLGSYDATGKQVVDDNRMSTTTEKIAWQINKGAQLSWFNDLHYKWIGHRNGTGTNVTSFAESRARVLNDKWPNVNQIKFTSPLGTAMVVDMSYGRLRADDRFAQQPEVQAGDISRFDQTTNTYTVAWPTYSDNIHRRDQWFASFSYFKASHDVRFGYQWTLNEKDSSAYSTSGMRAVYANGVPTSVNTYNVPITSTSTKIDPLYMQGVLDQGLYIQDKWTPHRKLVLNFGVRFETLNGWQDATCQPTTPLFTGGQCFAKIEDAPNFKNVLPRFAAVYDFKGDGRTAIKFSANRYDQPMLMDFVNRLNAVAATSDSRTWRPQSACAANNNVGCDLNGDLIPQLNELGPSSGFALGSTSRYADGIERPVSNDYTFELQHQLAGDIVISGGYTHRETRRNFGQRNVKVPANTYIPIPVTEVNSGQKVTVYNQDPNLRGQVDTLFSNESQLDTNYNGGDITINRRMNNGWSLMGGASWGKTTGDILGGDLNNPNSSEFRKGNVGNDVPWSYRMSGIYEAPYGINVSGTAQYYSGFPETTTVSVTSQTVTLTQVTQSVVTQPRATVRLPNVFSLDMSLRKSFRFNSMSVVPRLDMYNLTNNATILSWLTQLGSTYHRASTIQHGRLLKVGIQWEF